MKPYRRTVHYYETDQMAIVHHSNYIRWFEEARLDYLAQLGISYADMEADGTLIPVVDVSCSYGQSVRYGDTVEITAKVTGFTGVRLQFAYEVRFADGALAATGSSTHCFLRGGRPVSLKRSCPTLYETFLSRVGEE